MITEKEILERLQKGEDAEKIANQLIDLLNAANAAYQAEIAAQKKAEEEAKKKAAAEKEKDKLADLIAKSVMEYIKLAVPTLVEEDEEELSGAEVRKILDPIIPTLVSLKDAVNSYTPAPASTNKTDDEILQGFLKGLF
jgi:hypothetical protein